MIHRIAWTGLAVVALGCGGASPPPAQPAPAPVPSPAAPAASVEQPATDTPPVDTTPSQPVEPTVEVALHPVVEGAEEAWVVGDTVLVKYGNSIGLIQNGEFEKRDDLSRQLGLHVMRPLTVVYGRWPDVVFAQVLGTDGRSGWGELYKLQGGKTFGAVAGARLPANWQFVGVSPWSSGRWLSLKVNRMPWGPPPHVRFRVVHGSKTQALPAWPNLPTSEDCPVPLVPQSMISFESGELIATGTSCRGEAVAMVWPPNQTAAEVTRIDGRWIQSEDAPLLGSSASHVISIWESRDERLAMQFDGKSWTRFDVPYHRNAAFSMDSDGALWQSTSEGTYKREGGTWKRVVPLRYGGKEAGVAKVLADGHGGTWAMGGGVLWHSEKPNQEVVKLEYEQGQEQRGTIAIPRAADWMCGDIFVLMYGMTKVTPKNYDYPLTRKALKGHMEFSVAEFAETEDGGRHYFGAFVQDLDLARKMARLVEAKVPGSKPQVLCVKPRVVRRLKIDMRTGDVLANERVDGSQ